jgi:FkbM family methyltransferase
MLITVEEINTILQKNNITINGSFHIGAHDCEELPFYHLLGIKNENMIWIDAIQEKVEQAKNKGIINVYNNVITDKDDEDIIFNISNNVQSSSILELKTHKIEHPNVFYVDKIQVKTITVDTFFERNNFDPSKYDFWNFDIQGAELLALHGATNSLKHAKVLYLEVNEKELYKNCGLISDIDIFLKTHHFTRVLTKMLQFGWGDAVYIKC